jgi:TonB family protein
MEAQVAEASAPEFGRALLAAVEQFVYEPALKGGRPTKSFQAFRQDFRRDERYQIVSDLDLDLLAREQKRPQTILTPRELDAKLTPISQRPPRFPLTEAPRAERGEAVVELVVDEDGRSRLPRVVSASSEAFGEAAVSGVAAWRFEPPTRGGRATFVRVQVPITFTLKSGDAREEPVSR